ncbi:MAG: hypothetical protein IT323_10505 [Anaerolineae bacterium]|nr:hypothetical protein [Anaerolineae bacterium]
MPDLRSAMPAKHMPGEQDSPIIYIAYCEQDKRVADAITGHFRERLPFRAPDVSFDFGDNERHGEGTGHTVTLKAWAKDAWYVLFIVSHHWAHLRRDMLTELFVWEDRASEVSARYGDENRLISMLCLEEPNAKVATLLAKYNVACLPYTTHAQAELAIDILIDRFGTGPVWKAQSTTAL